LPVGVCPVDCIHPKKNEAEAFPQVHQLYIDPEECIDCGACEPVVPFKQSSKNDALAEKWKHYAQINADYSRKRANRTFSNPLRRALADMEQGRATEKRKGKVKP